MPRGKRIQPRLVAVDEVPKAVRRSVYVELVEEFARSDMKAAKLEGAKVSSLVSVKKAIAALGLATVSAVTANGEVYLTKK